jgi:molybdopterin synthase sulfur carrier subunit
MQVRVLFFGVLSEVVGTDCRFYKDVRTMSDLIHRINDDYPRIGHYSYRISLNSVIIDGEMDLKDLDEVALLPPFAGG